MQKMTDPFKIDGPAIVSFSGGRTSGYMLWRILQAHGGTLPPDVYVAFDNTGKEMSQTLDFVNECADRWSVEIVWLEYQNAEKPKDRWRQVTYETASREGEPFKALIDFRQYLPNPVTRFCTQELKIHATHRWAKTLGLGDADRVIGLRADETQRVSRIRAREAGGGDPWTCRFPLYDAGITKEHVSEFWARQNFTLQLPNINGVTPYGNCDLCFLKSAASISGMMRDVPALADWWIEAEAEAEATPSTSLKPTIEKKYAGSDPETDEPIFEYVSTKRTGARFRIDRPSYAEMLKAVQEQRSFNFGDRDALADCFCHD